MEKRNEATEANEATRTNGATQTDTPRSYPRIRKTLLRKAIPYILVGCIASSAVMMSYNKAREVKAVAVVDDIILLTALLATAGIAYVGISEYWTNGQWLEDEDSPVLDPEMAEWGQGFADRIQEQWDNDVLQKAIELGYVDPETGEYIGALEGTGGSGNTGGDGDNDDDNNKFPTWQKLKELVAKNGGNLSQALGTGAGFLLGAYGATMLESSKEGAKMPGGLEPDVSIVISSMKDEAKSYCEEKGIDLSELPYELTEIRRFSKSFIVNKILCSSGFCLVKYDSGDYSCGSDIETSHINISYNSAYPQRGIIFSYYPNTTFKSGIPASTVTPFTVSFFSNIPVSNSWEEGLSYYDNPYPIYPDTYINPSTIGKSTALAKKLAETGGDLTKSLYENATLPTTEQLNQYFEDLNNAEDEEEKQKIMDEFVDSLVNPTENPNPNPDPDNPDKPTNPDIPTNNDIFLADLKHLFPFCIPFDLVDCFKLFNAEPVTPRVEIPVHFGIINYDHTFVIDLKDFNGVAVVCRSAFLIIYMAGLILATRALIKG
jgi:hypothetical protein